MASACTVDSPTWSLLDLAHTHCSQLGEEKQQKLLLMKRHEAVEHNLNSGNDFSDFALLHHYDRPMTHLDRANCSMN